MVLRERQSTVHARFRIGEDNGIFLSEIRRYQPTIDVASVAANTVVAQTFTVTGLVAGDLVLSVEPDIDIGLGIGTVRVSTADTLSIEFINPTGSGIDPASGTWNVLVARPSP